MESTLTEYKSPLKCFCQQNLATLATRTIVRLWNYFVHNRRLIEVFDRYFHIPLPIVTKHELGLPVPPRNLRIKFGPNPSTIFSVVVVTDKHTQTDTNQRRRQHSLTFAGINIQFVLLFYRDGCDGIKVMWLRHLFSVIILFSFCILSLRLILDVSLVSVCDVYTNAVHWTCMISVCWSLSDSF